MAFYLLRYSLPPNIFQMLLLPLNLPPLHSTFCGITYKRRRIVAGRRISRIIRRSLCSNGKTADGEMNTVWVSDPIRSSGLSPDFLIPMLRVSSSSSPPPSLRQHQQRMDDGGDKQDYYLNLGNAIRTLREDYPVIFYEDPSFDIYRDDIIFKDPLNTFVGIDNYRLIFWALRFIGRLLFKALWVDIVSIWQPVERMIMIRWTVHGIPRVPWESCGRFDGICVYMLDEKGKIFEHRADNIVRSPPLRFRIMALEHLIRALGSSIAPNPTYLDTFLIDACFNMSFLLGVLFLGYYTILWFCLLDTDPNYISNI